MKTIIYTGKKRDDGGYELPKDKSKKILESTTRKCIDKILKKHKVFYFAPVNFGMGKEGIPDVIACVNGHFVGIEAKGWKTGHILTEAQKKTLSEIDNNNGITFVANPFNLEQLDELIGGLNED